MTNEKKMKIAARQAHAKPDPEEWLGMIANAVAKARTSKASTQTNAVRLRTAEALIIWVRFMVLAAIIAYSR